MTPEPASDAALDELEQVDFFLAQALLDEALSMLDRAADALPATTARARKMSEVDAHTSEPDATGVDASPGALPRDPTGPRRRPTGGPPPA